MIPHSLINQAAETTRNDGRWSFHLTYSVCTYIYHRVHKSETKVKTLFSLYFSSIHLLQIALFKTVHYLSKSSILFFNVSVIDIRNVFKRTTTTKPKSYNLL